MIEHNQQSKTARRREARYQWHPELIKALREHMALTQRELADQLEVRQQTISEWETGLHTPHRSTQKVLTMLAERSSFTVCERVSSEVHVEPLVNATGQNGSYAGAFAPSFAQNNGHVNHGAD